MRRATSGAAFKMVCSRPADGSWARLGVNQGEAEGVDFRPRLKLSPQICPQDCPRGAAAGRFLWESCVEKRELLKQSDRLAVFQFDRFGVGDFGESGHGDDVAEMDDGEAAAALDLDVTHIYLEIAGNIQQSRII